MTTRKTALAGLSALLLYALTSSFLGQASAHHANNLGYMDMGGDDHIINYDFDGTSYSDANKDWPVTVIFTNNAEIDSIKDDLNQWYHSTGKTQYGYLRDDIDDGYIWDADRGRNQFACPYSTHYRIYAPPSDRMYNTTHGYYVFATTHEDRYHYDHCGDGDEKFGWSETASNGVRNVSILAYGSSNVTSNAIWMGNANNGHWSDNNRRWWRSDGYAHKVQVP